jgi:hypothetical protein
MIWNQRGKRYIAAKIVAEFLEPDFSAWTIEKLRDALSAMGLAEKAQQCCEKGQLIDLMNQFRHIYRENHKDKKPASSPIPEGQFRLCSRQRHDGVVQAPPVLSDGCRVSRNRVESYMGSLEGVENWLQKNGDRRRFYGVYDSDRNYCFGLIWKNNKQWARAGQHDW